MNDILATETETKGTDNTAAESAHSYAWPSPQWIAAYRAEATNKTMAAVARCADIELRGLDTEMTADDLVQHALVETLNGTVKWPAGAVSLRAHLRDKVRTQARRLRRQAALGFEHTAVSLDDADTDAPVWLDERMHAPGDVASAHDVAKVSRAVERELIQRLAADPIALRVLAAMPDAITIAEIALAVELPAAVVRAAKLRIQRAAMKIDRSLRQSAREVLSLPPLNHAADALSRSQDSEP